MNPSQVEAAIHLGDELPAGPYKVALMRVSSHPESEPPEHPGLPEHLACLFTEVGTGTIGRGRYAIHDLMSPAEVYDEETAASLKGILIVGDDFSGNCEAYDASQDWTFGSIDSSGEFSPHTLYATMLDFLEAWYCSD